ncbi:MAG: ATP-binding protein [Candidatus Aminicenantes bacterium]|nr:ATP-binding protein [Candidatus Aminicenantes bacterium]
MKDSLHLVTFKDKMNAMRIKIRRFWLKLINDLWQKRSVLWLSGVRRIGKTCLCQSLPNVLYFDCELPRTRREMEDPESFLESHNGKRIILDEIHRLGNPSELLKIAADHYPDVKVIATGSSTLGASTKFKDTLSGRKLEIWLTPMISDDLQDFGKTDLKHRLFRGGLPPFFMAREYPEREFQEWMDAYWAKDIQELFRLERRYSFQRFTELIFLQSGRIFEATKFSIPCEVSRTTISNYLSVLEATFVVHVIRPFSSYRASEIVAAPKVYAFDTGFVCHYKGWESLRPEDLGLLWEHYVLNEIHGRMQSRNIRYWRDKRHHEVDFILHKSTHEAITIECKWSVNQFDSTSLRAFRRRYPNGKNYVVANDVDHSFRREYSGIIVEFVNLEQLISSLKK